MYMGFSLSRRVFLITHLIPKSKVDLPFRARPRTESVVLDALIRRVT